MKKKLYHLAFVSKSTSAADMLRTLSSAMGIEIEFHMVAMEPAVQIARKLLKSGVDLVIACGTTGCLLKRELGESIITLRHSSIDVIKTLQTASFYTKTIAVACFDKIPDGLESLAELLQLRLIPTIFNDTQSLVSSISQCIQNGIKCIIGSHIAVRIATAQGIYGFEIPYNEVEAQNLLEETLRLLKAKEEQRIQNAFLKKITTCSENGILCFNDEPKIIAANTKANRLLNTRVPQAQDLPSLLGVVNRTLRDLAPHIASVSIPGLEAPLSVRNFPVMEGNNVYGVLSILSKQSEMMHPKNISGFHSHYSFADLAGTSMVLRELKERAQAYAHSEATILITGETGTGKELFAHAIHRASDRSNGPFVAINCSSLSESLLESELFGYEGGAFTGARRTGKEGIFTLAQKGTVFLDEIGDISPALQVRLLRVLESKEIMRVGGESLIHTDVRIICSSWKNLAQEVSDGHFRADLYYRLSLLTLTLPPLRERLDDIPAIITGIIQHRQLGSSYFSEDMLDALKQYSWPGNIRELDAFVQRYCILRKETNDEELLFNQLFNELQLESSHIFQKKQFIKTIEQAQETKFIDTIHNETNLKKLVKNYELSIIRRALSQNQGNHTKAAKMLGIGINSLWRKLKIITK